jgi:hypothetical protein
MTRPVAEARTVAQSSPLADLIAGLREARAVAQGSKLAELIARLREARAKLPGSPTHAAHNDHLLPPAEFERRMAAYDNALDAFVLYHCQNLAELRLYANVFTERLDEEAAEMIEYGEDATPPLWDFTSLGHGLLDNIYRVAAAS